MFGLMTLSITGKVTLAEFIKETGAKFVADQAVSLGSQSSISLSPSPDNSPIDSALLNKANELIIQETSTSPALSNYMRIWHAFQFDGDNVSIGFIFNQSNFLWQVSSSL